MYIRKRTRLLVIAAMLAAVTSTLATTPPFAAAQGINHTGPTGRQCNIKQQEGDFADPENDATTNAANSALSPTTGGGGPWMTVAGCELVASPPVIVTPVPTVPPVPPRNTSIFVGSTAGNAPPR
jgi:hypothetical protein